MGRNAAPVNFIALFGQLFRNHWDFPNSLRNNSSAFTFPSSVKATDLFLLTGLPM
jgi:hypothetical protein